MAPDADDFPAFAGGRTCHRAGHCHCHCHCYCDDRRQLSLRYTLHRMIVLMAGLPGTGKTTLASELARRTQGAILSKDEIRAALFSVEDIEYSVKQDDFVMEIMLKAARFLLQDAPARKILLDGRTFSRRYQIDRVLKLADELAQPWTIIDCTY